MLFGWFSTEEVDRFADKVVADLVERFPPAGVELSSRKSAERMLRKLDRTFSNISAFGAERRPNLYQKARFGNRIKWNLKEAGYGEAFVEAVTSELVKYLTLSASQGRRSG
jgi:hypothetical protein